MEFIRILTDVLPGPAVEPRSVRASLLPCRHRPRLSALVGCGRLLPAEVGRHRVHSALVHVVLVDLHGVPVVETALPAAAHRQPAATRASGQQVLGIVVLQLGGPARDLPAPRDGDVLRVHGGRYGHLHELLPLPLLHGLVLLGELEDLQVLLVVALVGLLELLPELLVALEELADHVDALDQSFGELLALRGERVPFGVAPADPALGLFGGRHAVLLRVVHVVDQLDVLVGAGELLSQRAHLLPELADEARARIVVDSRAVGDEGGLGSVGERGEVLLEEEVVRAEAGEHQAVGVAPDRLLQDRSQLRVPVRHVRLLPPLPLPALRQYSDHLPQREQRFIDVDALLRLPPLRSRQADAFRAGQVHQFDPAGEHAAGVEGIVALDADAQDGVAAGGLQVQFVGSVYPVLEAGAKVQHEVLGRLALVDEEILDGELLVLAPAQPQPLLPRTRVAGSVEQVVDALAVDLQEGERDYEGAALGGSHLFEQPAKEQRDNALRLPLQQLVPVHGVGLARARLPVGEDGGVVAPQCLLDEVVDFAGRVQLRLAGALIEDVVEVELAVVLPLRHLHLPARLVRPDAAVHVAALRLALQEGTDPDARLDLAAHLIILFRNIHRKREGRGGETMEGTVGGWMVVIIVFMYCGCEGKKRARLQRHCDSVDSPFQVRLIKMLGLHSLILDKFVFRRKKSTYDIANIRGTNVLYLDGVRFQPPDYYRSQVEIIEKEGHSVPVMRLYPIKLEEGERTPCIIYAHGNSSDLGDSLRFISAMTNKFKAEYVAFDFTGYGESRVDSVGEEVICGDLEMVLAWLGRPLDEVILWGFSLGSYPVTMAASKLGAKASILQCPIGSLSCMFYDEYERDIKFKEDHFANIDHIAGVRGRLLLMHSLADEIIPVEQARLLYSKYTAANGDKLIEFIEVEKIKHNAFHKYLVALNFNELQKEVVAFLALNQQEIEAQRREGEGEPCQKLVNLQKSITVVKLPEEFEEEDYELEETESKERTSSSRNESPQGWLCYRK